MPPVRFVPRTKGPETVVRGFSVRQTHPQLAAAYLTDPAPVETDTAQPVKALRLRTLVQALESDLAQPVTARRLRAVAQALESDSAQPMTRLRLRSITEPLETDTAQAVTRLRLRTVAQALETDTGQHHTALRARAVTQPTETDTAQHHTVLRARATSQPVSTSTAQPVTVTRLVSVGMALENDAPRHLQAGGNVNQAQTTDTAGWVMPVLVAPLSSAGFTGSVAKARRRPLPAKMTTRVSVSAGVEVDVAFPIVARHLPSIPQLDDSDFEALLALGALVPA